MRDLNKIILRGVIFDPPKARGEGDNRRVGFVVKTVTNESREDGSLQEQTTYHRVSAEGEDANAAEGLTMGGGVYVEGRLQTRKFRDQKSGQEVEATGVLASLIQPMDSADPHRNSSLILGNLGRKDPVRHLSKFTVGRLSIPTSSGWPPPPGKEVETEWHSVAIFGSLAEEVDQQIDKGQRVLVAGYVKSRKYTARDGSERRSTETVAIQVLGSEGTGDPAPAPVPAPDRDRSPAMAGAVAEVDDFKNRLQKQDSVEKPSGYESEPSTGVDSKDDSEDDIPF